MSTKTNKELNADLKSFLTQYAKLGNKIDSIKNTLRRRTSANEKARKAALGYEKISVSRIRAGMKLKTCGEFVKITTVTRTTKGYRTLVLANGKVKNVYSYGDVMVAL